MNSTEDQLRSSLAADPDDWSVRLPMVERLAGRDAGLELDMFLYASDSAPASEPEMRRVVDLANAHCPGYRGLSRVLDLFLESHLTSSWAHFILAQAHLYSGDEAAALRHYQTSKSLNGSRHDEELEALLAINRLNAGEAPPAVPSMSPPVEPVPAEAAAVAPPKSVPQPVPPKPADPETEPDVRGESTGATGNSESVTRRDDSESPDPGEIREAESGGAAESKSADGEDSPKQKQETEPDNDDDDASHSDSEAEPISREKDGHGIHPAKEEIAELARAAEKEDDSRQKISALSIALVTHLVLLVFFAFWQVVNPPRKPPQFVSSVISTGEEEKVERPEVKRYQKPRLPSKANQVKVAVAPSVSKISMPEMDRNVATFDPVGNGSGFGTSMSFGGGGSVSFFGAKSTSSRVVFVVDFSASMGGSKEKLMRQELSKSIQALPTNVEYALIFFGGPAWYAGQKPGEAKMEGNWIANVVEDGTQSYVWYEGWSEKERHQGGRTSALYHYSQDDRNLPRAPYRKATQRNIQESLKHIDQTELVFGTDWRWPLKMAMNMQPDTIFFMTDGAFGTGPGVSKDEMIQELLEYNRKSGKARINTICMMVLQARRELELLARGSGGQFTLVLQDGSTVRGSGLDGR